MAKFLFVYHGGSHPETPEESQQVMQAWGDWLGNMGAAAVDPGNPVGMSSTVNCDRSVTDNGGSNPASGYSIIEANDKNDAIEKAKGCPVLEASGSVEVAEIIEM